MSCTEKSSSCMLKLQKLYSRAHFTYDFVSIGRGEASKKARQTKREGAKEKATRTGGREKATSSSCNNSH